LPFTQRKKYFKEKNENRKEFICTVHRNSFVSRTSLINTITYIFVFKHFNCFRLDNSISLLLIKAGNYVICITTVRLRETVYYWWFSVGIGTSWKITFACGIIQACNDMFLAHLLEKFKFVSFCSCNISHWAWENWENDDTEEKESFH